MIELPVRHRTPATAVRRVVSLMLLALGVVLLLPSVTRGQTDIDRVVDELRTDPVYVDPDAENAVDPAAAERLRSAIDRAGTPIFVAILPDSAREGADAAELMRVIGRRLNQPATVAVVAGDQFRAGSNTVAEAETLATAALRSHRDDGVEATLLDFVDRLGQAAAAGGSSGEGSASESESSGAGSAILLGLLVLGGGALGFVALRGKRRRDQRRRREFADVRTAAHEDLVALGEDIRALDLDISMPGVDPKAVEDYTAALESYQRASGAFDGAQRAEDLAPVTAALEEGRFQMTSAKARLRGEEPPPRRLPCFFDPRHGPSVTDIEWAPYGGVPRNVPACAADVQRIRDGLEPQTRQVLVDDTPVPYWNAPRWFGPWAGGYFGGAGGDLLTGLLIGSALSGGWGGYDYGGGDFGGGDFGGGDFGGGDF